MNWENFHCTTVKLFLIDKNEWEITQGRGCGVSLWEPNALWYRIIRKNYTILNEH